MDPENQAPALDAASPEFDAAIRAGKYDAVERAPESDSAAGEPSPLLAALDESEGKAPAAVTQDAPPAEPANAAPAEAAAEPPAEDFKRKYESVAGNNRQLQQLLAQERQQREQQAQALAQLQAQMQEQADLAQIRASVPADLQEQAIAEYRKQRGIERHEQGLEAYRGFLQQQQQQLAQAQMSIFQQGFVQDAPGFARFVAQKADAPEEPLVEMAQSEPFRNIVGMARSQDDYEFIGQMMLAFAQFEAGRDRARKEQNAERAVAEGTHRDVNTAATGATGLDIVQTINGMSDSAFKKYAESVRQRATLRV